MHTDIQDRMTINAVFDETRLIYAREVELSTSAKGQL